MIRLESYAKLNLTLEVGSERPDGFHEIETVMQTVSAADRITIERGRGIEVIADDPAVPGGEGNTAYRAAELLRAAEGVQEGCRVRIEKRIPAAAGLAGGSGNAAAVLAGLCALWGRHPSAGLLPDLAARIGSDVPFFLTGGTARCTGRGEIVEPLPPLPAGTRFLVATPRVEISSSFAYKELGRLRLTEDRLVPKMDPEPDPGPDSGDLLQNLFNRLEDAVLPHYPLVQETKDRLSTICRSGAIMSGSGPSVFGVLNDDTEAGGKLLSLFDDCRFTAVVHPVSCGFRFLNSSED